MIIAFSGVDGAGKSTQISALNDHLLERGKVLVVWNRVGYTPTFLFMKSVVRALLKGNLPPPGPSTARTKMLSSNITALIWVHIAVLDLILIHVLYLRFLRSIGYTVLCDRHLIDSRLDLEINFPSLKPTQLLIWKILGYLSCKPDIHFLLLVPPKVTLARCSQKNEPFPDDPLVSHWRYENYLMYSDKHYIRIDCTNSPARVATDIFSNLGVSPNQSNSA